MTERKVLIKPRCPGCGKVLMEEFEGRGRWKCGRCQLEFEIDTQYLTIDNHCVNHVDRQ